MYLVQNDDGLSALGQRQQKWKEELFKKKKKERRALLSPLLQAQNTYHFNIF